MNDVSKLQAAFDGDAWIFFIDADGGLHKHLVSEDFDRWSAPPSWDVVGRIVSVTQVGDAPSVQPYSCAISRATWQQLAQALQQLRIAQRGELLGAGAGIRPR